MISWAFPVSLVVKFRAFSAMAWVQFLIRRTEIIGTEILKAMRLGQKQFFKISAFIIKIETKGTSIVDSVLHNFLFFLCGRRLTIQNEGLALVCPRFFRSLKTLLFNNCEVRGL